MIQDFIDYLMEFGTLGLFIHSFIDAIIFPVPALFLQIPLSLMDPSNALWLATAGFVACLLGSPIGYYIGHSLGSTVLYKMLKKEWVDKATAMFQKNGEAAIMIGSFTPIPFKVFTILSGTLKFPLWRLLVYAAIGRAAKFYAVGALFYIYGKSAEGMVKDVSLYMLAIGVPLIVLFLFVRKKMRQKRARVTAAASPASGSEKADHTEQA
ncbi:YqaA family protein [Paenibacillus sp. NEAU-GSW1]|uniref:YqaA family protein n=1 Tax=Paenibacillus sp. NEAU-GSW1 TaxID=2682486 RepID=UPI0012E19F5E|nr:VTT domain-containing protein [Paenibacillus sp. NEAU-GSW1]MUT68159.1 DedA family protein [Paenibacillus sp. NEAU-GSW1]